MANQIILITMKIINLME